MSTTSDSYPLQPDDVPVAQHPTARIDPLQDPMRPASFMNYAQDETPADMVLRKLACWLGVGGYNAPAVDAYLFHRKIVDGIESLVKASAAPSAAPAQPVPGAAWNLRGVEGVYLVPRGSEDEWIRERGGSRLYTAPSAGPADAQEVDEAALARLKERGAVAWAGVDARALRKGLRPADALQALKLAREVIAEDRAALIECHTHHGTGRIPATDTLAREALARYDEALAEIDAAMSKGE